MKKNEKKKWEKPRVEEIKSKKEIILLGCDKTAERRWVRGCYALGPGGQFWS